MKHLKCWFVRSILVIVCTLPLYFHYNYFAPFLWGHGSSAAANICIGLWFSFIVLFVFSIYGAIHTKPEDFEYRIKEDPNMR